MENFTKRLISHCIDRKLSISIAESCTGGMIVSKLISIPGASRVIDCGLTTYSNLSKELFLNVPKNSIHKHGAVSHQVAELMVKGLRNKIKSDLYISITGIAGPNGGSKKKPIGTVYHSFSVFNDKKIITIKKKYTGSRFNIRLNATIFTIKQSYKILYSFI
ncbi:MAG: damage-inducible protein CinA [Pelagibacterales bacterium]|nr:damage-inducible protein CinA [Pelagibacterales bacterium]OUU61279.1 MAG: hypothetical protein CBC22_07880 [Alphaproteobacteria bacterium TMED62]|tara:strand:- start:5231 stop:5716 length:486 start_codon:yes stop_codon:yes gene_type:complete